ncbi:MAG: ATP-binding protein [Candidatus Cloacimonetes bacterium]|nr:ATP-binding protein [Candidatus Cloacimonadota bacterium]
MKIRTGIIVTGENFFVRQHLVDKVWDSIESENHILLVAPRRVGKTSLMHYLMDKAKDNYFFLFIDTESVNNENEFYRKLLSRLLTSKFVKSKNKVFSFVKEHSPVIKSIGPNGVEFDSKKETDYFSEFLKIAKLLDLEDKKLVLLLDEFSQTVENIKNDESERNAIHFLQTNRELRQALSGKIQFIYSGSIGLENIVRQINASSTINDIVPLKVKPFNKQESRDFILLLLKNVDFKLNDKLLDTILDKVGWLIPFYLQLVIQAINDVWKEENLTKLSEVIIDNALTELVEQGNYFEHWHSRLRTSLKTIEYKFAKELLNAISGTETIHSNEIHDLAVGFGLESDYKDIVRSLVYDGYINNNDDIRTYRFNSPILKMWWWKYVAN